MKPENGEREYRGTPIYAEVAEALEAAILRGEYTPGVRLPTELALAKQHGINRHTAARALNRLQSKGLVTRVERQGTFVRPPGRLEYPTMGKESFAAAVSRAGLNPSHEVLDVRRIRSYGRISREMRIPNGEPLVAFDQLVYAESVPQTFTTRHFRSTLFPDMTEFLGECTSLQVLVKVRYGVELYRARMTLELATADHDLAGHLGVPLGAALLMAEDLHVLEDGTPAQWSVSYVRGDALRISVEIREINEENGRSSDNA